MIEKVISSVVLVLFMCAMPALAQSAPDENDQEQGGEYLKYEGGVYAEVFGLSRSASLSSGPDHDFTLPENRENWLTIAEKIKNNEIDDAVYYAMLRGEKPEDIFTPDLMEIYQKNYEEWLLSKWEPSIENERTRLQGFEEASLVQKRAEALLAQRSENQDAEISEVVRTGPFAVFLKDGTEIYNSSDPGAKCDPSMGSTEDLKSVSESNALPTAEQLNLVYKAIMNELTCQRKGKKTE